MKKNCNYNVSSCLLSFRADLNHQDATGRTPLHVFFNGSARTIIEFHQEDLDNTTQDSRGMNIAQYVSWSKSSLPIDLFRCCSGNIASRQTADEEGKTALHFACQRGNLELLEYLFSEENDAISCPDWHGRTLMHYATESGRSAQAIDMLARRGFDVRAVDHQGKTVLHHAASVGNVAAVEKLIELGARGDLNALDDDSRAPMQVAALCGRKAVVEYLQPLCDEAELPMLPKKQIATNGHERENYLKVGWMFISPLPFLFGFALFITCMIFHFVY